MIKVSLSFLLLFLGFNGFSQDYNSDDTLHVGEFIYPVCSKVKFSDVNTEVLNELLLVMTENPSMHIQISSHTTTRGTKDRNREISKEWAQNIEEYLEKSGIAPDRIRSNGYGEDFPLYTEAQIDPLRNTDRETFLKLHQSNQRTVIVVTEL